VHEAILATEKAIRQAEDSLADALKAWLIEDDFDLRQDRYYPESFGNRVIDLTRRRLSIRLVRDRSEWSIEIAGPDGKWTYVVRWGDLVQGPGFNPEPVSFSWQVEILEKQLDPIQSLADGPDFASTAVALARLSRASAPRWLDPKPTEQPT
jgi:hypothetical protein